MNITNFIKTASLEANRLVAFSSIALLVKIFLLNRIPSFLYGMHELGLIIEAVLASVIASYAFYLLAIHAKEISDGKIVRPYLWGYFDRVVNTCNETLISISAKSEIEINLENLTRERIQEAFNLINPYDSAPLFLGFSGGQMRLGTWLQFLNSQGEKTQEYTAKLLAQLLYLSPREVSQIISIDECSHFKIIKQIAAVKISSDNLEIFSSDFYDYCKTCQGMSEEILAAKIEFNCPTSNMSTLKMYAQRFFRKTQT